MTAIGKTESGRFKDNKNVVIWPWTINTGKKSLFFDNKLQMKNFVLNEIKKEIIKNYGELYASGDGLTRLYNVDEVAVDTTQK